MIPFPFRIWFRDILFKKVFIKITYTSVDLFNVSSFFVVINYVSYCCIYTFLFFIFKKNFIGFSPYSHLLWIFAPSPFLS